MPKSPQKNEKMNAGKGPVVFVAVAVILAGFWLAIPETALAGTFTLGTGSSQTVKVYNDFSLGIGTTVSAATNNPTIDVDGNFFVSSGATFTGGSQTMTVGTDGQAKGNFKLIWGSTWNAGSGTLILDGGNDTNLVYFEDQNSTKQNLGNVQIGASPATTNMNSDMSATNLTIASGDRLNTRGYDITLTGNLALNGTLDVDDTVETDDTYITVAGNFTTASGATYTDSDYDSEIVFTGNASADQTFTTGGKTYGRVTLNNTQGTYDDIDVSGNLTLNGNLTITDGNLDLEVNDPATDLDVNGNVSIGASGTLTATSTGTFTIGGSWSNAGTLAPGTGTITFDSTDTGETINSGGTGSGKNFYNVVFNNSGGGWTVQTNNVLVSNNLTFTSVSSWANTKTTSIRVGGTLTVSANQDIRMWNSSAANGYSISGTLYSMDHNSADGTLYVWGDYHTQTNDYWSYATDFDGTDISGTPRQVYVFVDPSSNVTVDSGDTLAGIGAQYNMTLVDRQGTSGGYGITVSSGGTINFEYVDFENLDGPNGLYVQSANVTDLDYCKFNNLVDSGATDAFIRVDASVITSNKTWDYVQFDNSSGGANYNVYRTGTPGANYWEFVNHTGIFDGATYEYENGGGDMIRWISTIDSSSGQENFEGTVNFEGATTFQ